MSTISANELPRSRSAAAKPRAVFQLPAWTPDWAAYSLLVAVIVAVLVQRFDYGVVLHDMGTIGHAAERVLHGELPHRDFDDPYTGLLSLVNAGAFQLLGVSLLSTRIVLLMGTLIGFSVLYLLCRRIASPWIAALASFAAFTASVPNYFSSMPTWYNLYCTLAGALAMSYYADTRRLRWVAVAGLCTGLSFLFKSVGLYFLPAAALFAVFIEQRYSEETQGGKSSPSAVASWLTFAGLWSYATVPTALVFGDLSLPTMLTFVGPSLVLVAYLSWNERRLRMCEPMERLRRLVRIGLVFVAGMIGVVALYLVPYMATGDVGSLFYGVFVQPLQRLESTYMGRAMAVQPFVAGTLLWLLVGFLAMQARGSDVAVRWMGGIIALVGVVILAAARYPEVYATAWSAARMTPIIAGLGLCWYLASQSRRHVRRRNAATVQNDDPKRIEATFLLIASAGVFSLVQYPLSHGIYFLYVAPLVVVAALGLLSVLYPQQRLPSVLLSGWIIAFAVCWMLPGRTMLLGVEYQKSTKAEHIEAARCPTYCDPFTAREYAELIEEVHRHTQPGSPILALPDSPDVYFITGCRNPTRTFFDAFDYDYATPERDARLLRTIEEQKIKVLVMRNLIEFSPQAMNPTLWKSLMKIFPNGRQLTIGGFAKFGVYWRDGSKKEPSPPGTVAQRPSLKLSSAN